jgi:hypothetical protein
LQRKFLVDRYCSSVNAAIVQLEGGNYPKYRERVALQRAVFGLASLYGRNESCTPMSSLSGSALKRLRLEVSGEAFLRFERLYAAADLIAIVASSDPYSVSDDFIASLARHSPYAQALIDVLRELVDEAQAHLGDGTSEEA